MAQMCTHKQVKTTKVTTYEVGIDAKTKERTDTPPIFLYSREFKESTERVIYLSDRLAKAGIRKNDRSYLFGSLGRANKPGGRSARSKSLLDVALEKLGVKQVKPQVGSSKKKANAVDRKRARRAAIKEAFSKSDVVIVDNAKDLKRVIALSNKLSSKHRPKKIIAINVDHLPRDLKSTVPVKLLAGSQAQPLKLKRSKLAALQLPKSNFRATQIKNDRLKNTQEVPKLEKQRTAIVIERLEPARIVQAQPVEALANDIDLFSELKLPARPKSLEPQQALAA